MIKLLFLSNFIDIAAFNNVVFVKTNRSFSYMEETSSLLGPQGKPGAHGRSEYVKLNYLSNDTHIIDQLSGYNEISGKNLYFDKQLDFSHQWGVFGARNNFFHDPHIFWCYLSH